MYGCFKSFLSNVDIFAWSAIWLPSYHKLHIWLGYGCQERFMVVNPGSNMPGTSMLNLILFDLIGIWPMERKKIKINLTDCSGRLNRMNLRREREREREIERERER